MKREHKQVLMALFIAVIMIASGIGFAMLRNTPTESNQQEVNFPNVIERLIEPQERLQILRGGKSLIEFLYPENCTACPERRNVYESFATSEEFKDYIVLETAVSENATAEWMIMAYTGDQIPLEGVNTTEELANMFCASSVVKPNICLLQEV